MSSRSGLERMRRAERWAAVVRLLAVPFAVLQILLERHDPPGYEFLQAGGDRALDAPRVFRRDLRAEHSRLGLFIARSIAEAHGGTPTVRSSPGRGATFRLALPA